VICAPPSPCQDLVRDSSNPKCCVYSPRVCPGDACDTPSCVNSTDSCITTPVCNASDVCNIRGCTNGTCWSNPVNCTSTDFCKIANPCDIALGGCTYYQNKCDDSNNCTDDSCVNGACVNTPRVCNDGLACTDDSCNNEAGGLCQYVLKNCTDNNVCTIDTCDNNAANASDPCVFTPINVATVCNDNNLCTDDTCDAALGCLSTPVNVTLFCNLTTENCVRTTCDPGFGCQSVPRTCELNTSSGLAYEVTAATQNYTGSNGTDCSYAVCQDYPNATDGKSYGCVVKYNVCPTYDNTTLIISTVTTAAIVGICLAAIALAGACGGGAYAAYTKLGPDDEAVVHSSPLYTPTGKGGDNLLYNPDP